MERTLIRAPLDVMRPNFHHTSMVATHAFGTETWYPGGVVGRVWHASYIAKAHREHIDHPIWHENSPCIDAIIVWWQLCN